MNKPPGFLTVGTVLAAVAIAYFTKETHYSLSVVTSRFLFCKITQHVKPAIRLLQPILQQSANCLLKQRLGKVANQWYETDWEC